MTQHQRTELLFGKKTVELFQRTRVAVLGLGGVGSFAAEGLARSGIGSLLLADFDTISVTNLNRNILALHSTIDQNKTEVMKQRIMDINPRLSVDIYSDFVVEESREKLLQNVDFVVDAIDSLGPKVGLLEAVFHKKIKIISVLGAGGRTDPSQIRQADISQTKVCPLARKVRKYLHRRDIYQGIPVIFSTEKPVPQFDHFSGADKEWNSSRGRKRGTLSSAVHIPAIMGMWAAGYVLNTLSKPVDS